MQYGVQGVQHSPVSPRVERITSGKHGKLRPVVDRSFSEILQQQIAEQEGLKFSAHALRRIQTRGIHLDREELGKLNQAVAQADRKGARESLVLFPDHAFVVSVKNKTVITAINREAVESKIFTNIDSAVIVQD